MNTRTLRPSVKNWSFEYLDRPYPRKQKGGTVIARQVRTLEEHLLALADPDRVRLTGCMQCKIGRLHVHERRERVLAGEVEGPPLIDILIFRCSRKNACGAVWRVLPEFLARHLWRRWTLVGVVLAGEPNHRVPARTVQRWRARLASTAAVLVALLGQAAQPRWLDVAAHAEVHATRRELVETAGGPSHLAELARIVHELQPGVRVM